jgi:hypothetical protein
MRITALVLGVVLALAAVPAVAQDVKIEAPRPGGERPDAVDRSRVPYDRTRPTDRDYYPEGPRVSHDPAFIEGMSSEYQTANSSGRVGIAGWTSPNPPLGPEVIGHREVTGWFGLGFTVTWGEPLRPTTTRPPAQ